MEKKMNNKGFSLVELIIVIAIMAVLVGVLAPQYMKYVEQSRRGKDIQAAANLQTAYLADIADGTISADLGASATAPVEITDANKPSTVSAAPAVSGRAADCEKFYVFADVSAGTVQIFIGKDGATTKFELTIEGAAGAGGAAGTGAQGYKAAP